jgi:phosphate starvation-inducible PhoH-like protein
MAPKRTLNGGTDEKPVSPTTVIGMNEEQRQALRTISQNTINFIHGPAGSGKTWLALAFGLSELLKGRYERLVLTRPCIEANGEKLGYLPGDPNEKIAPYMIPIFDILSRRIPLKEINRMINDGQITTLPLAFHRGVTFTNAYVVGDEFQNTIPQQMRMFLTRIGENSKYVITGDVTQSDINGNGHRDGLSDAMERFRGVADFGIIELTADSIVRHPIIKSIEHGYAK